MFTSPFYAGFTRHNGVVRKGTHPPMVSVSEYHQLQRIVRERGRFHVRRGGARPAFAYTGMMICGRCGLQVTAERHFKSGKWRAYYHCSDPYGKCTKRGINEVALEDAILDRLCRVMVDPDICEIALANIARWQGGRSQSAETVLAGQAERLRSVELQRDRLLTMMLSGLLSDEAVYRAKEAELLEESNVLQLAMEKSREDKERVQAQARAGFHFAKMARDGFLVADPQRKKEIALALGTRYVLTERQLSVTLHPLLGEMVKYADEIKDKLEPGISGKESQYRPFFRPHFPLVGVPDCSLIRRRP